MALQGSASIEIDAPIAEVFAVAADVENSPRWQPELKAAECLDRDAEGRQVLMAMKSDAKVKVLASTLRFSYDEPTSITWKQESGELKDVQGGWTLEDLGENRTRATYELKVDFGRMLGMAIRGPVVDVLKKQMVDSMPSKLKGDVEG